MLLIADAVTMEDLKQEGRLLAFPEADVAAYPAGMHDKDKAWFATKLITTGIVYNTRAPFQPQSWTDLARPETKGQVVMPSPLASGAALIHAATLTVQPRRRVGLLREAEGQRRGRGVAAMATC